LEKNYIGQEVDVLDYIPNVQFGEMTATIVNGGNLKAGIIQYAYQYFNKNGGSSTYSPATNKIKLALPGPKTSGGNDIGDVTNKSVSLVISNIDSNFNMVRVVSIFYDKYDSIPVINIIAESQFEYDDTPGYSLSFIDSGNSLGSVSLEEFRIFAQNTISPKIIEAKDNILFLGDINDNSFDISKIWDSRAYGYDEYGGYAKVYNELPVNVSRYCITNETGGGTLHFDGDTTNYINWKLPTTFNFAPETTLVYVFDFKSTVLVSFLYHSNL